MTWALLSPERKVAVRQRVHYSLQRLGAGQTAAAIRGYARSTKEFDLLTIEETLGALEELHASGAVQMLDRDDAVLWRVPPRRAAAGS